MDSYHERSFNFWKYCEAISENYWRILNYRWLNTKINCPGPKAQNQTRKGFSYFELKKSDLAKCPPLRDIDITTENYGYTTVIIVANDSVKGQGGISVQVKGTNGVGKGLNRHDNTGQNFLIQPDPTPIFFLTRSKNGLTRDPTRVFCKLTQPNPTRITSDPTR